MDSSAFPALYTKGKKLTHSTAQQQHLYAAPAPVIKFFLWAPAPTLYYKSKPNFKTDKMENKD
jgi:hypothetical protein